MLFRLILSDTKPSDVLNTLVWLDTFSLITTKDCILHVSSYGKAPCTVVQTLWRLATPRTTQHWYYKTITLNKKQMAVRDLAKGGKQLWLCLWPKVLREYSLILTPASHFIMIYSGGNAGWGQGGHQRDCFHNKWWATHCCFLQARHL